MGRSAVSCAIVDTSVASVVFLLPFSFTAAVWLHSERSGRPSACVVAVFVSLELNVKHRHLILIPNMSCQQKTALRVTTVISSVQVALI